MITISIESSRRDESRRTTIQCLLSAEIKVKEAVLTMMLDSSAITPRMLKTKQAAHYLNVSAWKLRDIVQAGEIASNTSESVSVYPRSKVAQ